MAVSGVEFHDRGVSAQSACRYNAVGSDSQGGRRPLIVDALRCVAPSFVPTDPVEFGHTERGYCWEGVERTGSDSIIRRVNSYGLTRARSEVSIPRPRSVGMNCERVSKRYRYRKRWR